MNDDRLLELIAERSPDELSGAELAQIRARFKESSAIREALSGRLQLEQALHQTVGQVRLPIELLLAKAAAIQATGTVAKLFGWGSATSLLIGMVSVGTMVAMRNPQTAQPHVVAKVIVDEPSSPSDQQPGDANKPVSATNRDRLTLTDGQAVAPVTPVQKPDAPPASPDERFFADDVEAATWRQSLESVSGGVAQRMVDGRPELVLSGTQILKYDWPSTGRMRLKLAEHDRFKIHLSHIADVPAAGAWQAGPSSLTLEFFAQPQPLWVAWLAAQRANQPLPEALALAAHDQGRLSQLGAGTIDVGYDRGRIVLTHGETQLLAAPLSGLPDRIVFEGHAVVHGLDFADGLMALSPPVDACLDAAGKPTDHEWQPELPAGTHWNVLPAGRVELLAEDSQADARAACSLGGELREAVFELEDPLPGTGVWLSDDRGEATYRLAFVPGDKANQVCFALSAEDHSQVGLPEGPSPLCPARAWFKLRSSDGVLKAWFSCDGEYWSAVLGADLPLAAPLSKVGVYCLAGPGSRSIRVARLSVSDLNERRVDVPPDLFGQVKLSRPLPFPWRATWQPSNKWN